jgi:hypothetical protein
MILETALPDKGTYGSGAITVVNPARSAVAPTVPSLLYIVRANKGNPAANDECKALFEAIADAAMGRYATTRYVKTELKTRYTPVPNGIDAMMGAIQCTRG